MKALWYMLAAAQLAPSPLADPKVEGLRALRDADRRVATIAYRLQTRSVELCSERQPAAGFVVHTLDEYQPAFRAAARTAFGLTDRPAILAVVPEGPAAAAGLAEDDALTAIDSRLVPPVAAPARASYARTAAVEARVSAASTRTIRIDVARQGRTLAVNLARVDACGGNVQLDPVGGINAYADAQTIAITTALLEFCRSDDELALAIGHELAHHILRHTQRLDAQRVDRGLLRVLPGNARRIRATEAEADRLGLYLVARAGYDYHVGPAFWERLEHMAGPIILSDGTHPKTDERIAATTQIAAEIDALRRTGRPLIPDDLALPALTPPPTGDTSPRSAARLR